MFASAYIVFMGSVVCTETDQEQSYREDGSEC